MAYGNLSLGVIKGVAAVALIVGVSRWVFSTKGAQLPRTRATANVYGIKWQLRALATLVAFFFVALPVWLRDDPDWPFLLIFTALGLAALWLTSGAVITDRSGITVKFVGYSRSLGWSDITAIQCDNTRGVIILRAGPKKLAIDSRFVATGHLLNTIRHETHIPAM